ncbi:MAG: replicative DNA helicase [Bacillota bacterium]
MAESTHEFQLLGILLQYPDQIDQAADELENRHFSDPQAGLIYEELLKQFQRDGAISRTKLLLKLREGDLVNNPEEMMERLTSGYNTRDELKATIELIKEEHQKRLIRKAAQQLQNLAGDPDKTIDEYQSRAQEIVFNATSEASDLEKHIFSMEEALIKSYESYIDRRHNRTDTGVQTGFMSLDRLIGGFKKGHLNVIAASTSMGKTAFAINIANNILKRNIPVGIISLEMEAQEIVDRMLVQEALVNAWKYSQGETNDQDDEKISSALNNMHEYPLMISDERGLNVAQIRARLRKFKSQLDELGLVIVDYLQMIKLPEESMQNTARAVGDIVLQLRNMASELEVPIILISQISRSFTSRQDKRPVLSDLRDSGNIEEIADGVLFLFREAHTSAAAREKAELEGNAGETDIIIAKQRTGQTGLVKLHFDEDHIRFLDPENQSYEEVMPGAAG